MRSLSWSLSLALLMCGCGAAATVQQAELHVEADRPDEAVAACKEILEDDPENQRAWVVLAAAYAQLDKPVEAQRALLEALRLDPNDAEAHYGMGLLMLNVGDLAQASTAFMQVLRLEPGFIEAHYYLGVAFSGLDELENAHSAFAYFVANSRDASDDPLVQNARRWLYDFEASQVAQREAPPPPPPPSIALAVPAPLSEPPPPPPEPELSEPVAPPPTYSSEAIPTTVGSKCHSAAVWGLEQLGSEAGDWVFAGIAKRTTDNEYWQFAIAVGLKVFWEAAGSQLMQQPTSMAADRLCLELKRLLMGHY